MMLRT